MKLRMHTLLVLMKKDFKTMLSNKNFILMALLPLLFTFLYSALFNTADADSELSPSFVLVMCQLFNLLMIPLTGLTTIVAEEKEKNTLRVLMLNDVSALEYLMSKILAVICIMEFVSVLIFVITKFDVQYFVVYILLSTLVSIIMLLLGATFGIVSKDQMSAGTLSSPMLILFMFPTFFGPMLGGFLETLSNIVPTTAYASLMSLYINGENIFVMDYIMKWVMLFIWIGIGIIGFVFIYRKKGIDN